MIKRFKNSTKKFYRVNERIFANTLRVLDYEGKQIGVMSKFEALNLAKKQMLDLVEIAPNASPAVAKIIDFKKFLYQEAKRKREERKSTKTSDTKEVRLGPFMSDNDLSVMVKRARDFLESGNKVRLVVFFSGRQITHTEFGHQILDKALEMLENISKVDRERKLEGRKLIILVSPSSKKQNEKVES
ncbi:MAG: translation initiation factor IF-3 [Candidatus Levybacteria bacterium]|nr:translation initiation factor IF-3 [Candidatus Levybacteria bacterium]